MQFQIQLNITANSDLLPVMFWIHGGAFYMGSGNGENDRFGPGYILDRDVVLITFNYRLGPLGEFYILLLYHLLNI
jgi:carboxylesterase type B